MKECMDKNPETYTDEYRERFYREYNRKKALEKENIEEKALFKEEVKERLKKDEREKYTMKYEISEAEK